MECKSLFEAKNFTVEQTGGQILKDRLQSQISCALRSGDGFDGRRSSASTLSGTAQPHDRRQSAGGVPDNNSAAMTGKQSAGQSVSSLLLVYISMSTFGSPK